MLSLWTWSFVRQAGLMVEHRMHDSNLIKSHSLESFLEADAAAPFLKISERHLKKLAREGRVPAHPRGDGQRRRWLFLLSELDAWMRGRLNSSSDSFRGVRSIN